MAGLAGGLGFAETRAGALTGGACLLGLYAGKGSDDEAEDPRLNMMIGELVEWFSDEYGKLYGGIRCDIILDNNPQSRTTQMPFACARGIRKG